MPNLEIETGLIEGAGHASATGRFDDEQPVLPAGPRHHRAGRAAPRRARLLQRPRAADRRARRAGAGDARHRGRAWR
nr:hypothetical protein [Angustibacter aerolatus]